MVSGSIPSLTTFSIFDHHHHHIKLINITHAHSQPRDKSHIFSLKTLVVLLEPLSSFLWVTLTHFWPPTPPLIATTTKQVSLNKLSTNTKTHQILCLSFPNKSQTPQKVKTSLHNLSLTILIVSRNLNHLPKPLDYDIFSTSILIFHATSSPQKKPTTTAWGGEHIPIIR